MATSETKRKDLSESADAPMYMLSLSLLFGNQPEKLLPLKNNGLRCMEDLCSPYYYYITIPLIFFSV